MRLKKQAEESAKESVRFWRQEEVLEFLPLYTLIHCSIVDL